MSPKSLKRAQKPGVKSAPMSRRDRPGVKSAPMSRRDRPGVERTLILLKPDAVARGLVGEIVTRFERKGLEFVGLKMTRIGRELAEEHYGEHKGKPFYEGLVDFITSGPVIAGVLEGRGAISIVRRMLGATSGQKAEPGTVRGDYSISDRNNLVHASDGPDSARIEIGRFFGGSELTSPVERDWIYDRTGVEPE